jgi:xanthine dehydrogenase accessory factor
LAIIYLNEAAMLFPEQLILIKGAGDLATGVAYRLFKSGFPLIMTELPAPLMVRRTVCFGEAVYDGVTEVEGVKAVRIDDTDEALRLAREGRNIPIIVDPEAGSRALLSPPIVIDAVMAKVNTGTTIFDAPLVIALGPGFTAGVDCHIAVETNRGHWLGRLLYEGSAQADTKTPGKVKGYSGGRVLRAPADGFFQARVKVGDNVQPGELLGAVDGRPVYAAFEGVVRGLIHPLAPVTAGIKIGDIDPRKVDRHCFTISEKSFAIGGAVLEAVLAWLNSQTQKPDSS